MLSCLFPTLSISSHSFCHTSYVTTLSQANSVPSSAQSLCFDPLLDDYAETSSPCDWLQALFLVSETEVSPNPGSPLSCTLHSISEAHTPVPSYVRSLGTHVASGTTESCVQSGSNPNCSATYTPTVGSVPSSQVITVANPMRSTYIAGCPVSHSEASVFPVMWSAFTSHLKSPCRV